MNRFSDSRHNSSVKRDTLLDFFADFAELPDPFLVYDDGFRVEQRTYRKTAQAGRALAVRLREAGVRKGDKVVIWSENRPEWIAAFWACLLVGAIVVPVDYRASSGFLLRIRDKVQARIVWIGDEVVWPENTEPRPWRLADVDWSDTRIAAPENVTRDDVAEIVFTSGATADPKGVIITHRNILANIVPVETEIRKYRRFGGPFFPLRFLNLLPLSHMFGQAMATFVPPMLPGVVVFMRGYSPEEIVRQIRTRRISVLVSVPKILEILREYVLRQVSRGRDGFASGRAVAAALVALPPHSSAVRMEVLGVRGGRRAARAGCGGVLVAPRISDHPRLRADGNRADRHAKSSFPRAPGYRGNANRRRGGEDRSRWRNSGARRKR